MLVPSLWKHPPPPISGLTKFLNPPFAGFSQAFPALETPLNPKHCSIYPPIFYFITPFLNCSGVQRERERKTTPFLKEISGWWSNTPLFYNSRAGLCRTKSTPLPEILGTRMRSLRPRSGGGGAGLKAKFVIMASHTCHYLSPSPTVTAGVANTLSIKTRMLLCVRAVV